MVRVAGIKAQVREGIAERSPDGMTPSEQLVLINKTVSELASDQQAIWRDLRAILSQTGITLVDGHDFTKAERSWLEDHFLHNIFPLLTPLRSIRRTPSRSSRASASPLPCSWRGCRTASR